MMLEILQCRGHSLPKTKSDPGSEMSWFRLHKNILLSLSHYDLNNFRRIYFPLDINLSVEDASPESKPDIDSICPMCGPDAL